MRALPALESHSAAVTTGHWLWQLPQEVAESQVPVSHAAGALHERHPLPSLAQVFTCPPAQLVPPSTVHSLSHVPQAAAVEQKPLGQSTGALQARQPWPSSWQVLSFPAVHSVSAAAQALAPQLLQTAPEHLPLPHARGALHFRHPCSSAAQIFMPSLVQSVAPLVEQSLWQVPHSLSLEQKPLGQALSALQRLHPFSAAEQVRRFPFRQVPRPSSEQASSQAPASGWHGPQSRVPPQPSSTTPHRPAQGAETSESPRTRAQPVSATAALDRAPRT